VPRRTITPSVPTGRLLKEIQSIPRAYSGGPAFDLPTEIARIAPRLASRADGGSVSQKPIPVRTQLAVTRSLLPGVRPGDLAVDGGAAD
jgi:hypothetical protein